MPDIFIIFLNGLVEGLTEFIPVSSTGHLIILNYFLALPHNTGPTFQIAIQLGAILAALLYYRSYILSVIFNGTLCIKAGINFSLAMVPTLLVAYFSYDFIKTQLFNPILVCFALIIGAVLMLIADRYNDKENNSKQSENDRLGLNDISPKQAFIIGCFQVLSLWPGMSRSGSCIIGGIFAKLNYQTSADFSFLLGIPIITIAVVFELFKNAGQLSVANMQNLALGSFFSFLIGIVAIKTVIQFLKRYKLAPFAIYRITLAAALLWGIMAS